MKGASPADIKCLDKKLEMSSIARDEWWPPGQGEHEVAFAFHVYTNEVRWYRGDKVAGDEWKAGFYQWPEWISGTADWAYAAKGLIGVDDLKTGRWPVSAADNKQLMTYAMPFWLEQGMPLKCRLTLSITQWERYPLGGLPKRNWWPGGAGGLDMMAHLQDLRWALEHPGEAAPDRETCMFCDCKNDCPDFLMSGIDFTRR